MPPKRRNGRKSSAVKKQETMMSKPSALVQTATASQSTGTTPRKVMGIELDTIVVRPTQRKEIKITNERDQAIKNIMESVIHLKRMEVEIIEAGWIAELDGDSQKLRELGIDEGGVEEALREISLSLREKEKEIVRMIRIEMKRPRLPDQPLTKFIEHVAKRFKVTRGAAAEGRVNVGGGYKNKRNKRKSKRRKSKRRKSKRRKSKGKRRQ